MANQSESENDSALKHLYNQALLDRMAKAIGRVDSSFDQKRLRSLMTKLKPLEMKPRVRLIRDELHEMLPKDYARALTVLLKSVRTGDLSGFDLWPYTEFIQLHGLKDPVRSLDALQEITKKFTGEWAVRPFLRQDSKSTLKYLSDCTKNKDVHVRRWASEGTRPRLPWGERLHEFVRDPKPTLKLLENLKFDEELYVRKSVSNHLNDIAKDHPDLVVQTLARWKKEAGSRHADKIDWTIHRSLRTLIKDGHAGALRLIGVSDKPQIVFRDLKLKPAKIVMGDRIEFAFTIQSKAKSSQRLVVDYVIHFVKANRTTAPKVFKMKTLEIKGGDSIEFAKSHHIKPITTRVYHPGVHYLEIQINGSSFGKIPWSLKL